MSHPVERLRRLLRDAAREQFAGVMDDGLGPDLRGAAQALLEHELPPPWEAQVERLRRGLDEFEQRGRHDRSRIVAHGLRICAGLADLAPPPVQVPAPAPASAGGHPLRERVDLLPGVGPRRAALLAAAGIETLEDLLYLLPRGYEDRRRLRQLDDVAEGERVLLEGVVTGFRQGWARGRYFATMRLRQVTRSGPIAFEARWFHPVGGLAQRVVTGHAVRLAGVVKRFRGAWSLVHPELLDPAASGPAIAVRYPAVEGVGPRALQRLCIAALERLSARSWPDPIPPEIAAEHRLPRQLDAWRVLHAPGADIDDDQLAALQGHRSAAHRRLAFEELFFVQLALLRKRAEQKARPCAITPLTEHRGEPERLRACVPFEPTAAQWRAIREIEADLASSEPMLRLLQGDVGSGKTLVAFASALALAGGGAQTALMAPTEILAEQHLRTLRPWCERAGLRVALLTAATPRAQRASLLSLLAGGRIDVLIGTHALLVGDVEFRRLGLVVVDEQHRFGVEQRTILRDKGAAPHLLVMTATPIPRSLALTAFGELDVSIIDELPPGRTPPKTRVFCGPRSLGSARRALCAAVGGGARAFVVCPLVEASETLDVSDVEACAAALREAMPRACVGVVHGRLPGRDKEQIMASFRDGELEVLVATTVIEVGVDVPEARVMLVEHAERFGLAQLHQLRGRVGRGGGESWCLVHTSQDRASEAAQRLSILAETDDGFRVAERDLQLRGPGELFGTRQSGVPRLRLGTFAGEGARLLVAARRAAEGVLDRLESDEVLRAELEVRTVRPVYSAESG